MVRSCRRTGLCPRAMQFGPPVREGKGVPKDDAQAFQWYRRAAELGHVQAQYRLGGMYEKGRGVPVDGNNALQWYTSAAMGHLHDPVSASAARYAIGNMYANDDEDMPKDDAQVIKLITRAAKEGHVEAQFFLGFIYDKGLGTPKNHDRAAKWYARAAEQGHLDAQIKLGDAYQNGKGVPQDHSRAIRWHTSAAEQGHAEAQFVLGLTYECRKDHAQAAHWYTRAAKQGHVEAQYFLSVMYRNGEGVHSDKVQAYAWVELASSSAPKFRQAAVLRNEIAANMSKEQLAKAQQLSRELELGNRAMR